MKDEAEEPASLQHDFIAHQHANVFARAFSFAGDQLPTTSDKQIEVADWVLLIGEIGFIIQLREREQQVASRAGDLEKWVASHVSRKGAKQIQNTLHLLASYVGLSLVNHFGHRVAIAATDPDEIVGVIVYRVPAKTRAFRAARFKRASNGTFVHILRDADYFGISQRFVTPAELAGYFNFRRDILLGWDPPSTAVSETALIGQYLLGDYSSPPDQGFERAARSRGGPIACEFSFILDSLASRIAAQTEDSADGECYEILTELALLGRYELQTLKQQIRLALEAVRANRFELPYRLASAQSDCGFLIVPVTREFQDRAFEALDSLSLASKHELDLERQVGIGMWKNSEFIHVEWVFLEGKNPPDPELDMRLASSYPFRIASERRVRPVFT